MWDGVYDILYLPGDCCAFELFQRGKQTRTISITMKFVRVSCKDYSLPRSVYPQNTSIEVIKEDLIRNNQNLKNAVLQDLRVYFPGTDIDLPRDTILKGLTTKQVRSRRWNPSSWKPHQDQLDLSVALVKPPPPPPPPVHRIDEELNIDDLPPRLVEFFERDDDIVESLVELTGVERMVIEGLYMESWKNSANSTTTALNFFRLMSQNGAAERLETYFSTPRANLEKLVPLQPLLPPLVVSAEGSARANDIRLVTPDPEDEPTFECPICYEDKHIADQFISNCPEQHMSCYECSQEYLLSTKSNGDIKCFSENCQHQLSPTEIAVALGNGNTAAGYTHPVFDEIDQSQLSSFMALNHDDFCTCPGCDLAVARSHRAAAERVDCSRCQTVFCSNCRRDYHYRTSCLEFDQLRREWRDWEAHGRATYWQKDKVEHAKAKQLEKERERLVAVTEAEIADEKRKEETCRHCPHCNRVVEKIGGCNAMVRASPQFHLH